MSKFADFRKAVEWLDSLIIRRERNFWFFWAWMFCLMFYVLVPMARNFECEQPLGKEAARQVMQGTEKSSRQPPG